MGKTGVRKCEIMNCPYCGNKLEAGTIRSPHEIVWLRGTNTYKYGSDEFKEKSIVLSEASFLRGSAVISHLCRDCRKIIIDIDE